jgi:hypothetical protein
LPGRRSSPQQTTDFHRTMAKVCKSGGEGTFAERHGNGEVAPIPAVRRMTIVGSSRTQRDIGRAGSERQLPDPTADLQRAGTVAGQSRPQTAVL